MTQTPIEPAPSSGRARVLLSPDGKQVAILVPSVSDEDARWFVVDPTSSEGPSVWGLPDDSVRSWIPVVGVNVLHEHIVHWHTTVEGRSGECSDRVEPGICCFPEGVATAVSDVEDLIGKTEEETWQA